jgi:hypothetical protein
MMGKAPTGKRIAWTENEIVRFEGGWIVESWGKGHWTRRWRQSASASGVHSTEGRKRMLSVPACGTGMLSISDAPWSV